MGRETGIRWTDSTWNPIRGCSRVSEGCRKPEWNGKIKFVEEHLLDPLKWKPGILIPCPQCGDTEESPCYPLDNGHRPGTTARERRIFVNSMSDLFHENVTDEMRDKIFAVMALCPRHIFQVLTKRPERMLEYLSAENPRYTARRAFDAAEKIDPENGYRFDVDIYWPLSNVWLGVSVEDQKTADERIPLLLQTPAAVRFISAEPLLGPISLEELPSASGIGRYLNALNNGGVDRGALIPSKLDWVIVGSESGPGARPMHPDWARGLRDQCATAGVPFFFKQWGEWAPGAQSADYSRKGAAFTRISVGGNMCTDPTVWLASDALFYRVGKKAAGHLLDGVEHSAFPGAVA